MAVDKEANSLSRVYSYYSKKRTQDKIGESAHMASDYIQSRRSLKKDDERRLEAAKMYRPPPKNAANNSFFIFIIGPYH